MNGFKLGIALMAFVSTAHADDWKFEKESNGVKAYTKSVENSKYKAYKGVIMVHAPVEAVVAHRDDFKTACKDWVYNCVRQEKIKTEGDSYWVHTLFASPIFMIDPRDSIAKFTYQKQPNGGWIQDFVGVPDMLPPEKGYVRVPKSKGRWMFNPKGDNQTEVTYEVHAEPGGEIPASIANQFNMDGPISSLQKFRDTMPK